MRALTIPRRSAFGILAILALTSCGKDKSPTGPGGEEPPKATTIALSKNAHGFTALRDSTQLTASVRDQRDAVMESVSVGWTSSDTAVVRVNASGWVLATGTGTARVVATAGAVADTATIEVAQVPAALVLSPDSIALLAGDTTRLGVLVSDANGAEIGGAEVAWTSSDTAVATVDDEGLVTAFAAGEALVVARAGEAADTVAVTIAPAEGDDGSGDDPGAPGDPGTAPPVPATIVIAPDSAQLIVGETGQPVATVRDADGAEIADAVVAWSSEDEAVATVDSVGLVTAVAVGTTRIVAGAGEVADTMVLVVRPRPATITLTPNRLDFDALGDTVELAAVVRDGDGHVLEGMPVSWSSTDPEVAGVDREGRVVAMANGTARVVAKSGPVADTATVTVAQVAVALVVPRDSFWVGEGETARLVANLVDRNEHPIAGAAITYWSPDASIATIDPTGLVTGVRRGRDLNLRMTAGPFTEWVSTRVMDQLVFQRGSHIYRINQNGSGLRQLTTLGGTNSLPIWSPDGEKFAFTNSSGGSWNVYVMNADGSGQVKVSTAAGNNRLPSWSPDGRKIVYQNTVGTRSQIYIANADGSGDVHIDTGSQNAGAPDWSSTDRIVYHCDPLGRWSICTMDADGGNQQRITLHSAPEMDPKWSADGRKIVFERKSAIGEAPTQFFSLYVMGDDGDHLAELVRIGATSLMGGFGWHPDDDLVTYLVRGAGNDALYVVEEGGSGPSRVVLAPLIGSFAWGFDWEELIFTGDLGDGLVQLYTVAGLGATPVRIPTPGGVVSAAWRPNP